VFIEIGDYFLEDTKIEGKTAYLATNRYTGVEEYLITSIEGGFLVLNKVNGKKYRCNPGVPFCECPNFKFRRASTASPCKHCELTKPLMLEKKEIEKKREPVEIPRVEKVGMEVERIEPSEVGEVEEVEEVEEDDLVTMLRVDEMDDLLITEQIVGAEPLVYNMPTKREPNKPRYRLSIRGMALAKAIQGNLIIDSVRFEKIDGKLIAIARGIDKKRNIVCYGYCERYNNPEYKITQLSAKAQRNAIRHLLLPHIEQKVIEHALSAKSVIFVPPYER
jgi:hypothetical protein